MDNWNDFIKLKVDPNERDALQKHERTGRPLGGNGFISQLEAKTGRMLKKKENRPKRAKETTVILYRVPRTYPSPERTPNVLNVLPPNVWGKLTTDGFQYAIL